MFDLDRWREIFQAISNNKLRTVLTGFTVAFAIMLFTLLFGISNGLFNTFKTNFASDAENIIYVWAGKTSKAYKGLQTGRKIQFKNEDYKYVIEEFGDDIQYISARVSNGQKVIYKEENGDYEIRGIHPDYNFFEQNVMESGRYISRLDIKKRSKVVAIGRKIEKELFGKKSALHKNINIGGISFKVIGVYSDSGGDNDERFIYMPIATAQGIYGNNDYISTIVLSFNPKMSNAEAIAFGKRIKKTMKRKHSVAPRDQSAIRIHNRAESMQEASSILGGLNFLVIFIGLGTLIAGIIGISNIMVFVVKERTKELGIRKALGAKPSSIIGMILQETIFITVTSGFIGLLFGTGILKYITPFLEEYEIINPTVGRGLVIGAVTVLVLSGIIAGYLPAKRASKIKPIEALNAA